MNDKVLKFRVYIRDHGKYSYFRLNEFDYSDRYLYQHDCPVQQFTGVKDINGEDIYEGDIVKRVGTEYTYEVTYSNSKAAFLIENGDGQALLGHYINRIEVIGNVQEPHKF